MVELTPPAARQCILATFIGFWFFTGYNHLFKDTSNTNFFTHFRYGGWYTDLDTVTLRRTDLLKNAVANSQGLIGNSHCLSLRLCI